MDIMLNDILHLTDEEIKNSKIEFNMRVGSAGMPFIDIWMQNATEDKENGTCPKCSYWAHYGKKRNYYPGQTAFSFDRLADDEWLLISAARIIDVPEAAEQAKYEVLKEYAPLYGRLIIRCKKGNTFSRYTFNLDRYIQQATVKEILPCLYSGENFEGYDQVNLPYRRLEAILTGKMMPTYYEALKKITGVYCLTDTHTGRLYIGSAYGEDGVAQRWGCYLDSKHGGNKKLIDLYKKEGSAYFEEYFTFTLLEYFGLSYDPGKIIEREQYWKKCLDTIRHGYNDN